MTEKPNKEKVISFLLGLILGAKGVSLITHIIYIGIIVILLLTR